ncbi:MAG: TIR domain-containing protein [Bacteroidales bacterium]|nr:TIR domain-containing protein [Bacteroidales bacterium]
MGRNVFVSYKYADSNVAPLKYDNSTTVRDYVNILETILAENDHAYYGEHKDEDLSWWTDYQIYERLKNKIFPTSCTIVLISPNMRECGRADRSQWIPWEIYYSLRQTTRSDYMSRRNGILAVVLPDRNGSYDYAIQKGICCSTHCTIYYRNNLFNILKYNMFNRKSGYDRICVNNDKIWDGEFSYIPMVKWGDFINNVNYQIERVEKIRDRADEYDLHVDVDP